MRWPNQKLIGVFHAAAEPSVKHLRCSVPDIVADMNQPLLQAQQPLTGVLHLPPDKSIAHRLALFAALSDGPCTIANFPESADPQSTLSCLRQLGVSVHRTLESEVTIVGQGLYGLQPPASPIDCGNSGTTMRLLCGILAGQEFPSTLTGDDSLRMRPMERIERPLRMMGADISLEDGHAPIAVRPVHGLKGITYAPPVASAQVKSCILLAGLYASGSTTVAESVPSRDHTERLLGLSTHHTEVASTATVEGGKRIKAFSARVPADFSAAAFFLVAASIVPGSEIHLPNVGLNPSRTGLIEVLRQMGASIDIAHYDNSGSEPVGDIICRSADLHAPAIDSRSIPNIIDELPIIAVAALCAKGRTEVRGASELRVKECDRIDAMVRNLRALGAAVEEFRSGFAITGGHPLRGTEVDSFGDHRIAMAMGVAGLICEGITTVRHADCVAVSFPGFWDSLVSVQGMI